MKKLYEELDAEISAIFAPDTAVSKFANKHDIVIKNDPIYVELKDVKDFIYEELYLKNDRTQR